MESVGAKVSLANCLRTGLGIEKDLRKAFLWYLRAARSGVKVAAYALACMYRDGLGVAENSKRAEFWFQKAQELPE